MEIVSATLVCKDCQCEKSTDEFYKNYKSKDGLHSYCRECNTKRVRDWHRRNRSEKAGA